MCAPENPISRSSKDACYKFKIVSCLISESPPWISIWFVFPRCAWRDVGSFFAPVCLSLVAPSWVGSISQGCSWARISNEWGRPEVFLYSACLLQPYVFSSCLSLRPPNRKPFWDFTILCSFFTGVILFKLIRLD